MNAGTIIYRISCISLGREYFLYKDAYRSGTQFDRMIFEDLHIPVTGPGWLNVLGTYSWII
jgi:hypothetical protein